jgi:hypothetical protein
MIELVVTTYSFGQSYKRFIMTLNPADPGLLQWNGKQP